MINTLNVQGYSGILQWASFELLPRIPKLEHYQKKIWCPIYTAYELPWHANPRLTRGYLQEYRPGYCSSIRPIIDISYCPWSNVGMAKQLNKPRNEQLVCRPPALLPPHPQWTSCHRLPLQLAQTSLFFTSFCSLFLLLLIPDSVSCCMRRSSGRLVLYVQGCRRLCILSWFVLFLYEASFFSAVGI